MAVTKAAKHRIRDELGEKFNKATAAIVAEYSGMTTEQMTALRRALREVGTEFRVVKNRVAKIALRDHAAHNEALSPQLKGPIGVAFVYKDTAATAKKILDFEKDIKENFKVLGGVMDGKAVSQAQLKAISELPSKEVLLAQIIGSLVAPHRGLLGVLNGVPRQLVQVINAIKEKKA